MCTAISITEHPNVENYSHGDTQWRTEAKTGKFLKTLELQVKECKSCETPTALTETNTEHTVQSQSKGTQH